MALGITTLRTVFGTGVSALALATPSDTPSLPSVPSPPLPHVARADPSPAPAPRAPDALELPEIPGIPECDRWVFREKIVEWATLARQEDLNPDESFRAAELVDEVEAKFVEDPRYRDEVKRLVFERGEAGNAAAYLLAGRLKENPSWGVAFLLEVSSQPVSESFALYGGVRPSSLPSIPDTLAAHENAYNNSYPNRTLQVAYRDLKTIFPLLSAAEQNDAAELIRTMLRVHNYPERESPFAGRPAPHIAPDRLREVTASNDPARLLDVALTLDPRVTGPALERIHDKVVKEFLGDVRGIMSQTFGLGRTRAAIAGLIGVVNDHCEYTRTRILAVKYLQDGDYFLDFKRIDTEPIDSLAKTLAQTQEPRLQEALVEFFVTDNLFHNLGDSFLEVDGVLNVLVEVAGRTDTPIASDARTGIGLVCTSKARGDARGPFPAEAYLMASFLRGDPGAERGILEGLSSTGDEDAREHFRKEVRRAVTSPAADIRRCAEVAYSVYPYFTPEEAQIVVEKLIPAVRLLPRERRAEPLIEQLLGRFAHFGDPDDDGRQSPAQLQVARSAVTALVRDERFPRTFSNRGLDEKTWDGLTVEKRDLDGLLKFASKSGDLYGFAWLNKNPEFKSDVPKILGAWGPAALRSVRQPEGGSFGYLEKHELSEWLTAANTYLTAPKQSRTAAGISTVRTALLAAEASLLEHARLVLANRNVDDVTRIAAPRELRSAQEGLAQIRGVLARTRR